MVVFLSLSNECLIQFQKCLTLSGLSEQDVNDAKKLPILLQCAMILDMMMLFTLQFKEWVLMQCNGSWSELVFNYLKEENQRFYPRDHEIDTQDVQYISIIHLVSLRIRSLLEAYYFSDVPERREIINTST